MKGHREDTVYHHIADFDPGVAREQGHSPVGRGGQECALQLSPGGVAACGATNAPVGTDTVTGTYSGGGGYAKSSGTATLTVTP